jgi:uncharacterized protein (DUF952 family)
MHSIFHIASHPQWEVTQASGAYDCESLETEGFIHCSTHSQIIPVAHLFFKGQSNLVLLWIDADRLTAELRYDRIETGESFPHVYGAINRDAIVQVFDFEPDEQGRFTLPSGLPAHPSDASSANH